MVSMAVAHSLLMGFSMLGTDSRQLLLSEVVLVLLGVLVLLLSWFARVGMLMVLSGAGLVVGGAVAWAGWLAGRGGLPWRTPCSCG